MATVAPLVPPPINEQARVAPLWHTLIFVLFILSMGALDAFHQSRLQKLQMHSRLPLYAYMVCVELVMFFYVWFGLRLSRTKLRDIIGGRWSKITDVLRDIGVAIVFEVVVAVMLIVVKLALGSSNTSLKAIKMLVPQTPAEMVAYILVALTAGFCEEVVFRGYLQRQFIALTRSTEAGIILQAIVFGSAHLYQGVKGAITITVYGALFGILAVLMKSLRPGMLQHAGQDTFTGILVGVLAKRKLI